MLEVDAVTFDHFMTLVHPANDTEEDIVFPILETLRMKVPFDEGEFMRRYSKKDSDYRRHLRETCHECLLDDIILGTLDDMGLETESMKEIVHNAVDVGLTTREIVFYPDALDTIEGLRERGYLLGLISNTHWRWLEEYKRAMESYFDVITLSYEHGYAKPHHSIFLTTLNKIGVDASRCLHVGDSPIDDIQGAIEAGLKTAFIKRDGEEADSDIKIDQLAELLLHLVPRERDGKLR